MKHEQHPLARNYIPQPSVEEVERIKASIVDYGFDERYPIWLYEGKILVGWTRYQAAMAAKVEPVFREYDGDEPVAFMLRSELPRRHISTVHRLRLAEELRPELEAEAKRRMAAGTKQEADPSVPGRQGGEPSAALRQGKVSKQIAEAASVSERTAERFHAVEEHGTEQLKAAMHAGTITVKDAAQVAKLPAPVQKQAVAAVKKGKAKTAAAAAAQEQAEQTADVDRVGVPLDERSRPIFEALAMFKDAKALIRKALQIVNELANHPGGKLFYRENLKLEAERFYCHSLSEGRRLLEFCEPYARCPSCFHEGRPDRKCKGCRGSGIVNKIVWDNGVPDYCRAVLKLATNQELAAKALANVNKRDPRRKGA